MADNEWLAGDFSIAGIANWSWCRIHNLAVVSVSELPNLRRWMAAIDARPGCAKGVRIPHETDYNTPQDANASALAKDVQAILVR